MKILFVNAPFLKYDGVEGVGGKSSPLNLGYLASYIRQQKPKFEINILDCDALNLSYEQIKEYIAKKGPDIVAITMPTPVYEHAVRIADLTKELDKKIFVVVGGPHPTALPKETLLEKSIDFAVIGEGEFTLLELLEELEKNKKNFNKIKGLAYKDENGNIFENERRELIKNLDLLPFPAKDMMPLDVYYSSALKRITSGASTNMITSRGCPFNCNFCMAQTIWGRQTRFRSIKNVVDEIEENIKNYNVTDFIFHDDFFTVNRQRVLEFCDELKKRNLNINWVCQARCGAVDKEMLRAMKNAGCGKLSFGFESGDEDILKLMQKNNTLANARESARLCKKVGIKVTGYFILGYPGETKEAIEKTIQFSQELELDTVGFFIATPYPGTELFRLAMEKNYIKKPIKWKTFAPLSSGTPPMDIPNITKEELLALKKKAYQSFYLRPRYIFKKLSEIKSIDDAKNLWKDFKTFRRVS